MRLPRSLVLFAGVLMTALGMTSIEARADFRVCNATQNLVGVAIGYRAKTGWVTEGWWHIEGAACKTLLEGPLSSRYYYLYAEDAQGGGRWEEGQHVRGRKRIPYYWRPGLLRARFPAQRLPGIRHRGTIELDGSAHR